MTMVYAECYGQRLGKLSRLMERAGCVAKPVDRYGLVVFAADHGVSVEGYSAYAPLSSADLVNAHLQGISPVARLMQRIHRPEIIVDVGLYHPLEHPRLLSRPVCRTMRSFLSEDAQQPEDVQRAVEAGGALWDENSGWTFDIIGVGEIGVGNTLAAEAITCVLTGLEPEQVVGKGSSENKVLAKKNDIIGRALHYRYPDPNDYLDLLVRFGGLEIAALAGFITKAVESEVCVVLDGFVTTVAAALAAMIKPGTASGLIAASLSAESGHQYLLDRLGLKAALELQLNYGEGLAAAISMFLLEVLCRGCTAAADI